MTFVQVGTDVWVRAEVVLAVYKAGDWVTLLEVF